MIIKPNFFVVGTPKGGTTSLFNYLEEHPEVYLPDLKEPHFFSFPEVTDTYYKATIINNETAYLDLYNGIKKEKAIGDLSTSYLFNKNSAGRIKEFNPGAKIIIILRNPVMRSISHYLMDYNLGYIDVPFFKIIEDKEKYSKFYREYIKLGYYDQQITNYFTLFDKSQILVILSDELFSNPLKTISKIYKFIGVNESFVPNTDKKYNQYSKPKFKFFKKIARSENTKYILNFMPNKIKRITKGILYTDSEKPKLIDESKFLKQLYRESIIKTSDLINKDLSGWL